MRRRDKLSGKAKKAQRSKTLKRRKLPKIKARQRPTAANAQKRRVRRTGERDTLGQLAATVEVLRIISNSPGRLAPVFETILDNCVSLCGGDRAVIWQFDGHALRLVGGKNTTPEAMTFLREQPVELGLHNPTTLAGRERRIVHEVDVFANSDYRPLIPIRTPAPRAPTVLAVPLIRQDKLLGVITIWRHQKRAFTNRQIDLVEAFASQAVIAIENARLFEELRETLQQQTATANVLRIISASPDELEPVFNAILENATRVCEAKFGTMYRFDGASFYHAAGHGTPEALVQVQKKQGRFVPELGTLMDRVMRTKGAAHSADYSAESALGLSAKFGGARSTVVVPMLKDSELVGAFAVYRQEVRPFTSKQIALLENFAAQAVIAIENARLLKELRERTNQLANLNQQLEQRVTDQVGEIERMSRLRRFLPPQVADLIVASGTEKQLESHRREITALFCDLRGFTGFSESSDPEDVIALLREYHAAIGGIINKYGGTLERYAGDGVMIVFNDPIPVDNPALQAVLMAIDMRAAISELIERWRKLGHDIGFGIGIAHGFATLGTIGFEGRFDYAAIGTVSNVASRLCDEAKSGQILISPRVLMAVEKDVTIETVGDFTLKGIRRPLTAYNVLDLRSAD